MNKIKNIIFDWGNVLIDVRPENFIEECKKVGVKFTNREVNSTHKAGFFLEHEMGVISDKRKHSKKCTFYTLRFGCSFAAVNTIKPQLL